MQLYEQLSMITNNERGTLFWRSPRFDTKRTLKLERSNLDVLSSSFWHVVILPLLRFNQTFVREFIDK